MKNERIYKLFDDGKAEELFRGQGRYFIPDVTWRDTHDLILVVGQFLKWARERDYCAASHLFLSLVESLVEGGEHRQAVEVLITYKILINGGAPPVEVSEYQIFDAISSVLSKDAGQISIDEGYRNRVVCLLDLYPRFKPMIGLK